MYSTRVTKSIADFLDLYQDAENVYKRLQTLLGKIDDKIHNEFRYCSRALKEFVAGLPSATEDESVDRLQKASHAAKNALNDSVDLILGFASAKISEFSHIDSGKELVLYVPNLIKVMEAISSIHNMITESKSSSELRVSIYKEIIQSTNFNVVVKFCEEIPIYESHISADYSREIKSGRRFVITFTVSILGLVIGIIGIIQTYLSNVL